MPLLAPRSPPLPSGQWHVRHWQQTIATNDGRYRVLVWQPDGARGLRPLILYAPGWGGRAEDGSLQLAYLASHGYVAVAFDDVSNDPPRPNEGATDTAARKSSYSYDTPAAYAASFASASRKVQIAARKGQAILDTLLSSGNLAGRVDPDRVGFLGFSFGGATAAEQSILDHRIKAVVNLDGWVFDKAAQAAVPAPYLLFYIDDDFPPQRWLTSADPGERAMAQGCAFDQAVHRRLLGKPDFYWLHATKAWHEELSGEPPPWQWKRPFDAMRRSHDDLWLRQAAYARVILAFFDRYLLDRPSAFPLAGRRYPGDIVDLDRGSHAPNYWANPHSYPRTPEEHEEGTRYDRAIRH